MRREFHIAPCIDEAMLARLLALDNGFLMRAADMSAEALKARFRRCASAFHCVLRSSAGDPELAGYFVLLPVNEACVEALRGGRITAGRHIEISHLAELGETAAAMYLSVVCAIGPRARRAAVEGVIAVLRTIYSTEGVRWLFARAATATGARMLGRLSGTTFEADGRIHAIDMSGYDVITAP